MGINPGLSPESLVIVNLYCFLYSGMNGDVAVAFVQISEIRQHEVNPMSHEVI